MREIQAKLKVVRITSICARKNIIVKPLIYVRVNVAKRALLSDIQHERRETLMIQLDKNFETNHPFSI